MTNRSNTPVIWRLTDGKAGHDSQSSGLCLALQEKYSCVRMDISCPTLSQLIIGTWHKSSDIPQPDLIIGAGHKTHIALLLAGRKTGASTIVIMKPSLPTSLFDLCLIPEHDAVEPARNIIRTCGAINEIKPSAALSSDKGLILIGGPSKRHGWDNKQLLGIINKILNKNPKIHWIITDSPRTPIATAMGLAKLKNAHLDYMPFQQSSRVWLLEQLATCGTRWVSEDSVSMIYEALTAGGNSYVLPVPRLKEDKITNSLDKLYQANYLKQYEAWQQGGVKLDHIELNESARCAEQVFQRLLNNKGFSSA